MANSNSPPSSSVMGGHNPPIPTLIERIVCREVVTRKHRKISVVAAAALFSLVRAFLVGKKDI